MYGEHFDGGMTKIESRDVNFIEDDFPSISEAKQYLQLYELQELEGVSCKNLKVSYHLWVKVENYNFILKSLKIVEVILLLVGANS